MDGPDGGGAMSPRRLWAGRILSGLAAAFLLLDATGKLLKVPPVIEGSASLGWPESTVFPVGVLLLAGVVLYLVPRTAILGAIYLAAYLGGAVATHVRCGNPLLTHVLFPIYMALLVWGALYLRDVRVRALIPFRGQATNPNP